MASEPKPACHQATKWLSELNFSTGSDNGWVPPVNKLIHKLLTCWIVLKILKAAFTFHHTLYCIQQNNPKFTMEQHHVLPIQYVNTMAAAGLVT